MANPHDNLMPNASPARKMFSSIPVNDVAEEVTPENRTGGMNTVKKLAQAIKKDGKLKDSNDQ